jgi:hypothetical protein
VVAVGTPEDIARSAASQTGRYLGPILDAAAATKPPRKTSSTKGGRASASGGLGHGRS